MRDHPAFAVPKRYHARPAAAIHLIYVNAFLRSPKPPLRSSCNPESGYGTPKSDCLQNPHANSNYYDDV